MFAIALYDRDKNRVILARDRVDKKPMYYHESESGVLFGLEINALLAVGNISRSLDYDALQLYLAFQYIPAPYSGFSAIRKVKPAHFMLIDDGKIKREVQYWNPHFQPKEDLDFETAAEQLRELFWDAVRLRTISDVPLGAFLSGGGDENFGGYKRYYNVLLSEKICHNRMVPFWILLGKLSLFLKDF